MNDALVVIPTYNECNNLPALLERIRVHAPGCDVLVVDDNSPDGTGAVADQLARAWPWVHVLHRPAKHGLGPAYIAGFKWALAQPYEYICQMDADHSHSPAQLADLLAAAKDYDLVLGSRYSGGVRVVKWERHRVMVSIFGNWYARAVTGLPFADLTGGFKCYRRHVLEAIDIDGVRSLGYAFQIETTWWAVQRGFCIGEVPITFYGREKDKTKFSISIIWEAIFAVWRLRLGLTRNRRPQAAVTENTRSPHRPDVETVR